MQLKTQSIIS